MIDSLVILRGGGDLATGIALRLHRAGIHLLITEIAQPLAVRRLVSFSEAVYRGEFEVEGTTAQKIDQPDQIAVILKANRIPVLVDPAARVMDAIKPLVLIDARITKRRELCKLDTAPLIIGLGPGFTPGENCHAAIETMRGHTLGRVLWDSAPLADTGVPDAVGNFTQERVLRAPENGLLQTRSAIGEIVVQGQTIALVNNKRVKAQFDGLLRGLLPDGLMVTAGMKIGDIDPRGIEAHARTVSDKSLAVGGGVLEAVLTRPDIREKLFAS